MRGKKHNFYNVYKEGEMVLESVTNKEVATLCGCQPGQVSTYDNGKNGRNYNGPNGKFKFEIAKSICNEPKVVKVKVDKHTKPLMPQKWINGWNNMYKAAELIQSGKGHIVAKRQPNGTYKRYVEAR
jgi:hypothetical protein